MADVPAGGPETGPALVHKLAHMRVSDLDNCPWAGAVVGMVLGLDILTQM